MRRPIKNINRIRFTKTVRYIPKDEATKKLIGDDFAYNVYAVVETLKYEYHINRTVVVPNNGYSDKFNRECAKAAVYAVLRQIDPPSSNNKKTFEKYEEEINNEFHYDKNGFVLY